MSIILATTTITVYGVRPQSDDPDDTPIATILAEGVRACISRPTSSRDTDNNDEVDEYALRCDVFAPGLSRHDTVLDDRTGERYDVRTVALSPTTILGLQHLRATLRKCEGLSGDEPRTS